jgi:hypothetical protein
MRPGSRHEPLASAALDPVVRAALAALTSWVYPPRRERRRQFFYGNQKREERSLKNPNTRAAAIHLSKHLKHHGYSFPPDRLRSWAIAHGWKAEDATELRHDAQGVLTGKRYHTRPDPFGKTRH